MYDCDMFVNTNTCGNNFDNATYDGELQMRNILNLTVDSSFIDDDSVDFRIISSSLRAKGNDEL